jgi:hypothetical protein
MHLLIIPVLLSFSTAHTHPQLQGNVILMDMECSIDARTAYEQNFVLRNMWGLLNAKALQRKIYAARILRYTSKDNQLSHM